jgi:hypothetical protein
MTDGCCSMQLIKQSYSSSITRIIARRYSDPSHNSHVATKSIQAKCLLLPVKEADFGSFTAGRCAHAAKLWAGIHALIKSTNIKTSSSAPNNYLCT